jgi:hypothetical protein
MPPVTGFYAALLALIAYAFVGSSRHLGVGPEPGTAILAATGVGAIAAGDPERYLALMAALALIVGAICLLAAFARLGFIANVLSKPVLVGYITGVGLTLLSSQYAKFTGVPLPSTPDEVRWLPIDVRPGCSARARRRSPRRRTPPPWRCRCGDLRRGWTQRAPVVRGRERSTSVRIYDDEGLGRVS